MEKCWYAWVISLKKGNFWKLNIEISQNFIGFSWIYLLWSRRCCLPILWNRDTVGNLKTICYQIIWDGTTIVTIFICVMVMLSKEIGRIHCYDKIHLTVDLKHSKIVLFPWNNFPKFCRNWTYFTQYLGDRVKCF